MSAYWKPFFSSKSGDSVNVFSPKISIVWLTSSESPPFLPAPPTYTHARKNHVTWQGRTVKYGSATAANKGFYTVVLELVLFVIFHRWQMFRSETWVVYLDTISKLPFSLLIVAKEKFTKKNQIFGCKIQRKIGTKLKICQRGSIWMVTPCTGFRPQNELRSLPHESGQAEAAYVIEFDNIQFQSCLRIPSIKKVRFRWVDRLVSCGLTADSCNNKYEV